MTDELTTEFSASKRDVLMKAAKGGNVLVQEMLEAIKALEKQRSTADSIQALNGEWLLVWTSGTKKYQEFSQVALNAPIKPKSSHNKVIQRLDVSSVWIENEVYFPSGSLAVAGSFEYTEQRIQFTFKRLRMRLKQLPAIQLPLGNWASGWLLSTYLDQELHIERGNQGGVSVYIRASLSSEAISP